MNADDIIRLISSCFSLAAAWLTWKAVRGKQPTPAKKPSSRLAFKKCLA
jgi:hypothetical protein